MKVAQDLSRPRVGAVIAVAVGVGFLVWLLFIQGNDDQQSSSQARKSPPSIVSKQQLGALSSQLGHPIYWAGPQPGTSMELTTQTNGDVGLRYLPRGTKAGTPGASFLSVGTYPLTNAIAALARVSQKPGAITAHAPNDGLVVTNQKTATSVYVAYPNSDVEIEVYDPSPRRAMAIATSGAISPLH